MRAFSGFLNSQTALKCLSTVGAALPGPLTEHSLIGMDLVSVTNLKPDVSNFKGVCATGFQYVKGSLSLTIITASLPPPQVEKV